MITLFELKHSKVCRCFVRTPYYMKNMILLLAMSLSLFVIYMAYFRKDCMSIRSISKVLKGLNSNTFNYLEHSGDSLRIGKVLNNYPAQMPTNLFMADCLRLNKPCKFEGLGATWGANEKWKFTPEEGFAYLKDKLADK